MLSNLGNALGDGLGRGGRAVGLLRPAYAAWLRAVYGRRGLPWRINGEPLRDQSVVDRIAEAGREGWLGEVDGLNVSLAATGDKLTQLDAIATRRHPAR